MNTHEQHRRDLLPVVLALLIMMLAAFFAPLVARAADEVKVESDFSAASPRQVEDTTEQNIRQAYAGAWQVLRQSLEENRTDLLPRSFVGNAEDQLAETVRAQQKAGLRTRYVDHEHKLEAAFYSSDGSTLQVKDTAQLEVQILDGDKVISSERKAVKYIALLTVAGDRWKVRVLQAVPNL